MNFKAIIKNVNKYGISGTIRLRNDKKRITEIVDNYRADFLKENGVKSLDELDKKALKKYRKSLERKYMFEILPAEYDEYKDRPIQNKVIMMENGHAPSPSQSHLADVIKKQGKYKVIMMSMNRQDVSLEEYLENGRKFVREIADAKAVFLSTSNFFLSGFDLRPETKLIQLWHGVGTFKKIGFSTVNSKGFGLSESERKKIDLYRNYDYVTIAAESQLPIFEEALRIPASSGKLAPIGVSRTDVFYDQEYIQHTHERFLKAMPQIEGKKIILYAPTFRGRTAKAKAPDRLDIAKMAERLSDDYVLLIKHHGLAHNIPDIPEEYKDKFAFDARDHKNFGIERWLSEADILITDYSSVAFEFALKEKPMIFFCYDLEEYVEERGLYNDFETFVPGPVVKTTDEICDYIEHIDERFDKQRVIDFKRDQVGACDGHATERTIELIEK